MSISIARTNATVIYGIVDHVNIVDDTLFVSTKYPRSKDRIGSNFSIPLRNFANGTCLMWHGVPTGADLLLHNMALEFGEDRMVGVNVTYEMDETNKMVVKTADFSMHPIQ